MAEQTSISAALDDSMENLRRMLASQAVDRAPTGRMQKEVEADVAKIPFEPQTREEKMQESINKIKRMEQNKQENESMQPGMIMKQGPMLAEDMTPAQKLMGTAEREPAVQKVGPLLKQAREQIMTPSEPSLQAAQGPIKQLGEVTSEALKSSVQKKQDLEGEANKLNTALVELTKKPAKSEEEQDAKDLVIDAINKAQKSQLLMQERFNQLLDKTGKPLFEKEDTAKVAILALAPIVAGYLVDGARGGAIGAQAGQIGLAKFESAKKDQLDREIKTLGEASKLMSKGVFNETRLVDAINRMNSIELQSEKNNLDLQKSALNNQTKLIVANLENANSLYKAGLMSAKDFAEINRKSQKDIADIQIKNDQLNLLVAATEQKRQDKEIQKKLPETIKTEYNTLGKKSGDIFLLKNIAQGYLNKLKDPNLSFDQKWQQAKLSYKTVNSLATGTSDVVGREEVLRIGPFAERKFLNITRPGSTFGTDLDEYAKMMENLIDEAGTAYSSMKEQQNVLLSSVGMAQIGTPQAMVPQPVGAPKPVAAPKQAAKAQPQGKAIQLSKDPAKAEEEYNNLPSGAKFIDPTGKTRTKP